MKDTFDFSMRVPVEKQPSAYFSLLIENLAYSISLQMQLAELKALVQNKPEDIQANFDTYQKLKKKAVEELKADVLSRYGE